MILVKNTTQILFTLRTLLVSHNLTAYIVPSGDSHYTEFVAECHQRRGFISGFTGSAGTAIVTPTQALLWTDGRYYFQAEQELDNNWTLMKDGTLGVPSQSQWLVSNLTAGQNVGVDPTLYTKGQWDAMFEGLSSGGLNLLDISENLVDKVWQEEGSKINCSNNPIFTLTLEFSGKSTSEKVKDVRKVMEENNATILVVTELDEIAWLLNLRGQDIPSSSTFFSYVILTSSTLDFFVNSDRIGKTVVDVLKENVPELVIKRYEDVFKELTLIVDRQTTGNVWLSRNANYALISSVGTTHFNRLLIKLTPISIMKAIKNDVEVAGYRKCLIRDAAALCEFFAWLESELDKEGVVVTEISASDKLYSIRKNNSKIFLDKSFTTISAIGINGAVIHYMPTTETDTALNKNEVYLLDSGGLYYDGTTDITRTMHFGTPTAYEKECYTRVLKGQIALATAKFPLKTVGARLDPFARQFLWSVGLEYNHGTGHGIGSFLNVHEGPQSIGSGYNANDPGLQENMFTSNEPGFYDEEKKFGIRLENLVRVTNVSLEYNFQNRGYLGFEDLTFVPYQHKMIDFSLLTENEIKYLNDYQIKARTLVGEHIKGNEMPQEAYNWLIRETPPINQNVDNAANSQLKFKYEIIFITHIFLTLLLKSY